MPRRPTSSTKHAPVTQTTRIIEAVKNPLGYLVLALIVTQTAFGVLATRSDIDHQILFVINLGVILLLCALVAILAWNGKLGDPQREMILPTYSIFVSLPDDIGILDFTRIVWDEEKCVMTISKTRNNFTPTYPANSKGASLEIRIPGSDYETHGENAQINLTLVDKLGNHWDVPTFRLWQINHSLRLISSRKKLAQDYADEGDQ